MPSSNIDDLKDNLLKDISMAQTQTSESAYSLGADKVPIQTKKSSAVRIRDQVVGKAELAKANSAIEEAVKSLSQEASLLDEVERSKLESDIRGRLSAFKEHMLKKSINLDRELQRRGYDFNKRNQLMQILGSIGGGMAEGFISSSYGDSSGGLSNNRIDFEQV
jgi:hypothetical protein